MLLLMSLGSSAPLLMAVAWLGGVDRVHSGVFDLLELHTHGIDPGFQTPIFVLVVAAALVRMGVVPFHSWLPAIWKGAPIPVVAMTLTAPAGVYLLARFGLPLLPHDATGRVPFIADLALITALYGAVLALGQRDLKRMLGALAISQSGMMLIGLASTNAQGETGALLLCIGDRAALCGLFLMVWMVRVRTGTTDMTQLGGLVTTMPRLAGGFLVFALAAMGAPGTLGFVAEDLLVSGIIEAYPWITVVVVVTTALNGITLVRAFSRIFLGPSQDPRVERRLLSDLSVSQRWVAAAVVLFLVGSGVFPGPLTASIRRAARQMDVEVAGD
jgi:NADH-quinone oxidoreductase subunit M